VVEPPNGARPRPAGTVRGPPAQGARLSESIARADGVTVRIRAAAGGTPCAFSIGMATTTRSENRLAARQLPKHGPTYTLYLFTALAVAVVIATVVGLRIAGVPHWF